MSDFFNDQNDSYDPPITESELSDEAVMDEIRVLKKKLSEKVVILGHHYQRDEIIEFADVIGDSLVLAKEAAKLDKEFIIFCGVHFMAETADILSKKHQKVLLPDLAAGCSMADMASRFEVEKAWAFLTSHTSDKIVPVTYINCTADLKAFVGEHKGSICTSSNAKKVISWALTQGQKLLFFPDQHLGRNTCFELGIPLSQMVQYDPNLPNGGLTPDQIKQAKIILWYGYCSVHQGFTLDQIKSLRKSEPDRKIIVHPECCFDVVQNADDAGSTARLVDIVEKAPKGSKFAIGTEINLVNRLAKSHPDKSIQSLSPYQCLCSTMYRIRPRWLLATLRSIDQGNAINQIIVPDNVAKSAIKALEQMLSIK